jgi:hypothetical protein
VDDIITAIVNPKKQAPKRDMAIALAPVARTPLVFEEKFTSVTKPRYAVAKTRSAG